ncbi:Proline-serine-threonine phosphatase-interacting protein 2 [Mortierella sp. AM989]|nr:Proline-serine-threonine phosphatase-interacting protein 2 [Mortierella sp. AM989]
MNIERPSSPDEQPGKDDAGYSALTTRMRHAKLTCQEILGMFQARAALEEEYGKKLLKLSKSPLGKDEIGTLRDSLDVVRYEVEATGKSHIELAGKMRDQLETALAEFNNIQKDKRKQHQASIDRTFRNKQLYLQQLIKAKEKYDAECVRTKGLSAAKMNLVGKELDKVSIKMEKTELASRAADVEYQASIRQLTEINDKWIIEWRAACDKFQLLEEQRIDYLRTTLWNYANIISSACVADDESCERIRTSLELCDVYQNLQSFIETCATGEEAPDIPTYLNSKSPEAPENIAPTQPQGTRVRTVCGPHQPIPSNNSSAPSSRRQSTYSNDADNLSATGPVEMALNIGGNLFKLDSQTAAMLNQPDEPTTPGGFPVAKTNGDRSPSTSGVDQRQSAADSLLGISLDASGTVKENRFPHWQSQASVQPQNPVSGYTINQYGSSDAGYSPTSGRITGGTAPLVAVQTRSQTMPIQNDHTRSHPPGADPNIHRKSLNSSYMGQGGATQYHHQLHQGQPNYVPTQQTQSVIQTLPDGRPILFYVRAIYDYEATIPEELSLKEGDILGVLHTRDDGWWEGNLMDEYRGPMRGLFPSNFTEPTA